MSVRWRFSPAHQKPLLPLIERRRLDTQRAKVNVPLATMMDLIIDNVKQQVVDASRILPKGRHRLLETLCRDLRPQAIDLPGAFVPKSQNLLLRTCVSVNRLIPISSDDSPDHWFRHADQLQSHGSERPHRTNGEAEEPVFREGLDHAPSQSAMSLPVLQQGCRQNHKGRVHVFNRHRHLTMNSRFTDGRCFWSTQ